LNAVTRGRGGHHPITGTTPTPPRATGANRAAVSVARKLIRRVHHILRRLGDQAYAPVAP
jgi:hypothetical protein